MADVQDVLIVGGGAAGGSAGLFAARDRGHVAEGKLLAIRRAAEILRRG